MWTMPGRCRAWTGAHQSPPTSRVLSLHQLRPVRSSPDLRYGNVGPGVATGRYPPALNASSSIRCRSSSAPNNHGPFFGRSRNTRHPRRVSGELPQLALIAADVPAEWRPAGSASLDAHLAGTLDNPAVAGEVASDGLQIAGQAIERLRSTLHVSNRILTVDSLNLQQGEGALKATGTYAFPTGRFSAAMSGKSLSLSASDAANLPIDARFDVELNGEGTLAAPQAQGFVQFSRLVWDGYDVGPARVDVDTVGRMIELRGRAPELSAAVQARVALSDPALLQPMPRSMRRALRSSSAVRDVRTPWHWAEPFRCGFRQPVSSTMSQTQLQISICASPMPQSMAHQVQLVARPGCVTRAMRLSPTTSSCGSATRRS